MAEIVGSERLHKLMARLFSDSEGERTAALDAFVRTVRAAGLHPTQLTICTDQDVVARVLERNRELAARTERVEAELACWQLAADDRLKRRVAAMKRPHYRRWARLAFAAKSRFGRRWRQRLIAEGELTEAHLAQLRRGNAPVSRALIERIEAMPPHRPRRRVIWHDWMMERLRERLAAGMGDEEIAAELGLRPRQVAWRRRHLETMSKVVRELASS